jgi:hypothetical protein
MASHCAPFLPIVELAEHGKWTFAFIASQGTEQR